MVKCDMIIKMRDRDNDQQQRDRLSNRQTMAYPGERIPKQQLKIKLFSLKMWKVVHNTLSKGQNQNTLSKIKEN